MSELVRRVRARDKFGALPTFDVPFLILLLLLLSYGLIMLFSAGYAVALYRRGDAYTYIRPRPVWWTTISGTGWLGRCWPCRWRC